ncbi:Protein of unknown function DUF2373 [Phaffia rhodozyma]|uniref:WKF domain-containing protein n=1 Tax=Phaffia rhodozyma TaxID=264483 RepID=A0A0F7SY11_PHARH|nr:Protein of unknown function DUF2373 [Phaffia rhodozyma]
MGNLKFALPIFPTSSQPDARLGVPLQIMHPTLDRIHPDLPYNSPVLTSVMSDTDSQPAPLEKTKKSKRSRTEGENVKEKKSKKAKQTESQEGTVTVVGSEPLAESRAEEDEETPAAEAETKKVKKSKKDKKDKNEKKPTTSLPPQLDISDVPASMDETSSSEPTLSAQATKAIEYAKTIGTPAFKFAKAKQGWLMRNVFSAIEIPDSSLETVLEYLKTVKGGSREHLIQQARTLASPPPTELPASTSTSEDAEQTAEEAEEAEPGPEPTDPEQVEDETTKKERESRQERANLVLMALNVTLSE